MSYSSVSTTRAARRRCTAALRCVSRLDATGNSVETMSLSELGVRGEKLTSVRTR